MPPIEKGRYIPGNKKAPGLSTREAFKNSRILIVLGSSWNIQPDWCIHGHGLEVANAPDYFIEACIFPYFLHERIVFQMVGRDQF